MMTIMIMVIMMIIVMITIIVASCALPMLSHVSVEIHINDDEKNDDGEQM